MPAFLFEHKVPGVLEQLGPVFTSHKGKPNFSEKEKDCSIKTVFPFKPEQVSVTELGCLDEMGSEY